MTEPERVVSEADLRRRSRRAFLGLAAGGLAAGGGLWWVRSRADADGVPWPLRKIHQWNEGVGRALFRPDRLSPEFPPAAAVEPPVNGRHGQPDAAAGWAVTVAVPGRPDRVTPVGELLAGLPRAESVTELHCVEGWSRVVHWGGVRFADLAAKLGVAVGDFPFVGLATPDGEYYVGLDAPSAFHPQTLLCDQMNGQTLPADHGGPLRLVSAVKYGIKSLKWVGAVRFAAARPADYWAERGYDWYAGL